MDWTTTGMTDPDGDPGKARQFFAYAERAAETGNFDYSIELFLKGLAIEPDAAEQHRALRIVALRRKAGGGKSLHFLAAWSRPRPKGDKEAMLYVEKELSYDPGNTDLMATMLRYARRAGCERTVSWMSALLTIASRHAGSISEGN